MSINNFSKATQNTIRIEGLAIQAIEAAISRNEEKLRTIKVNIENRANKVEKGMYNKALNKHLDIMSKLSKYTQDIAGMLDPYVAIKKD